MPLSRSRQARLSGFLAALMRHPGVRLAMVAIVAAAAWCDAFVLARKPPVHGFFDLRIYRGAVLWWLHGGSLYSFHIGHTDYGFTYPPFAALSMTPLTWFPTPTAVILNAIASFVVIILITRWLVIPVARRHGWTPWFAVAVALPVVLAVDPVRETLGYGQLNMFIFGLVLADVVALRRGWGWAGAGIGLATAVKLTPGLFILFLLLIGRRRPAGVATGTFLGASLVGVIVNASGSWEYWTSAVWDTSRVGRLDKPSNQSMLGLLAHLADPQQPDRRVWAVLAVAVLAVGMWRAVRAYRHSDDVVAFTLVGVTACLLSPISWTHHLYWVIPAAVILIDVAAGTPVHGWAPGWLRRRPRLVAAGAGAFVVAVAVPFFLGVPWYFLPRTEILPRGVPTDILGRSAYTIVLLALLLLLPARRSVGVREGDEPRALAEPGQPGGTRRSANDRATST
jgi:alpha-1,2-mannosyltransferase